MATKLPQQDAPALPPDLADDPSEAVLHYLRERGPIIAGLLAAILGGTLLATGARAIAERSNRKAQAEFATLLDDFRNEARDPAAGAEACFAFADDRSGSSAAPHARFLGALWLERADRPDEAIDALAELDGDLDAESPLASPIRMAHARLLEEAGRHAEAAEVYLARLAEAPDVPASESVALAAARNLEAAGRVADAREALSRFLDGETGANPAARMYVEARLAELPEAS